MRLEVDVRHAVGRLRLEARFALNEERGALWGPSAAGKSTLLRVIAGLLRPAEGFVRLEGTGLVDAGVWVGPGERPVGLVTQAPGLFPHLTVEGNVRFGLRGLAAGEQSRRVEEVFVLLDLGGLRGRRVEGLSGGERQRVALGRALVRRPRLLLLDEPFSALDVRAKAALWGVLNGYSRGHGMGTLLVSHDPAEVWGQAERVVRMEAGRVVSTGTPEEVLGEERRVVLGLLEGWGEGGGGRGKGKG